MSYFLLSRALNMELECKEIGQKRTAIYHLLFVIHTAQMNSLSEKWLLKCNANTLPDRTGMLEETLYLAEILDSKTLLVKSFNIFRMKMRFTTKIAAETLIRMGASRL